MYIDLSFQTTQIKTVVFILVSLNIRTNLQENLNLISGNSIKRHILDYEGIPFRCHRCHATGNLAKRCHLGFTKNQARKRWSLRVEEEKDSDRSKQELMGEIFISSKE